MKRIAVILLTLLCVCLLGGCQIAQLLRQVQGGAPATENSSSGEPAGENRAESSAQPGRQVPEAPTKSQKPASSPETPEAANSVGEGPLAEYIGMTYKQLADAYGPSEVFFWFEAGLYCHFEGVNLTFYFDLDMIYPHYLDSSLWLEDPSEFTAGNGDPVYKFDTGRYSPSDFKVDAIGVWDDTLAQLLDELGIASPATPEMLNSGFGQMRAAEENGMTGQIQAGMYDRGEYLYEFTFDYDGRYVTSARMLCNTGGGAGADSMHTILVWCDGTQMESEIIWLREPTNHGGMDSGGGAAYTLAPPLTTLFRTAPPQEGELYYARLSDSNGMVMQLDLVQPPTEGDIFFVLWLYEEVQELIQQGMTPIAEMERVFIDGNLCYTAALGTNHADHFVRERHYAVDVENWVVYEYDVLTDSYTHPSMG